MGRDSPPPKHLTVRQVPDKSPRNPKHLALQKIKTVGDSNNESPEEPFWKLEEAKSETEKNNIFLKGGEKNRFKKFLWPLTEL